MRLHRDMYCYQQRVVPANSPCMGCTSLCVTTNHPLLLSSVQKNRQRTMETLEVKEKEEEGEEEGEALYMVPLGERDEEGSGSQLEFMAKLSGVDATPSSTSDTSSSKSSNGAAPRTANPKLNQLMKGRHIPAALYCLHLDGQTLMTCLVPCFIACIWNTCIQPHSSGISIMYLITMVTM